MLRTHKEHNQHLSVSNPLAVLQHTQPATTMSSRCHLLPVLLLLGCLSCSCSARVLHQSSSCGSAGAACGASLSSSCHSSGLGYCQPSLFCGWTFSDTDKKTVCMPVPKDCGQPGKPCCPGNAQGAISDAKAATPKPTCARGSHCFYTPTPDASGWSAPPYASPAGPLLGTCRTVDATCGTAAGAACCPSQYHTGVNPPLPDSISKMPGLCGGTLFCNTTRTTDASGNYWPTGVCVANKPDAGSFGKSCLIMTSGVGVSTQCGPSWGVGYCVYPGGKATGDMRDQVCTPCPAVSVVAAEPSKYFGCKSM